MEKTSKRSRVSSFTNLLDKQYNNRQKETEIKLFENIKTDISIIISEQLKKRSKTEFELNAIKKKFIYLKCISEELERMIKDGKRELKMEEELIKNYFEYTTTNLGYVFIKYENIISDLSDQNGHMKMKLKNIKENELTEFECAYQLLVEKTNKLSVTKENILKMQTCVKNLKKEYEHVQAEIEIKKEEKCIVEKKYKELLFKIEEYKKEFEMIKEKCNSQMNEKKQSSIELSVIEEKVTQVGKEIQTLSSEKKRKSDDLQNLKEENENILNNIYQHNSNINDKCDLLVAEMNELESELTLLGEDKNTLNENYTNLEKALVDVSQKCECSKKENEEESLLIKELSNDLIKKKNNLKEKEDEFSKLNEQCNEVKNKNVQLVDVYSNVKKKIEVVNASINECRNVFEALKMELVNLECAKLQNEKTKEEISNCMDNSEKILVHQKNFFFKLSKMFQLINLSNEQLTNLQQELENGTNYNCLIRTCEKLDTYIKKLSTSISEKNEMNNFLQQDIENTLKSVTATDKEIIVLENEQKDLQNRLQIVTQKVNTLEEEMKKQVTNSGEKMKEASDVLVREYEELVESVACQIKIKHVEHNNFIKQGEMEKLEFDFQIFRSELISTLEQECEQKRKQIAEKEMQLKEYQERYSLLKGV
ncbi:hypothetical protein, conserved [Plasmodium gonderi]|uniref:Uncharacterized protein n=1 Tax=Plasmodium gonderi TaxID=77519 RepID=A0A1Y1JQU0_PLAGO|nr:hypothetical protein, conserved [Plasmodium gonderi]GAW83868.1 hypothetical protein, conserved [Plasmodium gonderi]